LGESASTELPGYAYALTSAWLKCNKMGRKGTPFPHLHFTTQSAPPPQIVIMLGKGMRPLSGAQT